MRRIFKNDFDKEHFSAIQKKAMTGDKEGCFSYLKNFFDITTADQINNYVERGDAIRLKSYTTYIMEKKITDSISQEFMGYI